MKNNIPNICVAVDRNAAKNKQVVLAYFNCVDTKTPLATNNAQVPFSPFSGGDLSRLNKKTIVLSTADIKRDLACIGQCKTCLSQQYTLKATAKNLAGLKNPKLHCTLCQTPYKVKAAESLIDAVQEHNDEVINDDELPIDMHGGEADDCLIQASDEDDDDYTDDSDEDDDNDSEDDSDNSDDDDSDYDSDEDDNSDDDDADDDDADEDSESDDSDENDFSDDDDDDDYESADDDDDDDLGEFDSDDDDSAETEDDEPTSDDDTNTGEGTETVEANTKELVINVLASTGGITDKSLMLVPVNTEFALVLANEVPVIKLVASAAGKNASLFADPNKLARAFNEVMANASSSEKLDLSYLGGQPIKYSVPVAAEIKNRINAGIEAVTAGLKTKEDNTEKDFSQCLSIAALSIQRNVDKDVQDPLKEAVTAQLKKFGARGDALVSAVNSIFAEAGEDYIKTVLAKAKELKSKPLSVRNEIAKMVEKSPYHNVVATSISDDVANKLSQGGENLNLHVKPGFALADNKVLANTYDSVDKVTHFRNLLRR